MTFSIINRQKEYRGHAFDVSKVYFQLPDGREGAYDLVEHGDSVAVVPVDEDGNLYFVSQHRIGADRTLLELPAGVLEKDEDPLICAMREIQEEIGMAAHQLKKLGGFYLAPGYTDEFMTVFLATELFESSLEPDLDEFIDVVRVPVAQAFQKAIKGAFIDGKTLAALLLAQPYLEKTYRLSPKQA